MSLQGFTTLLAEEFGRVARALVDAEIQLEPSAAAPSPARFVVRVQLAGPVQGEVCFGFDEAGATALTRAVMLLEQDPPPAAIGDALCEMCDQTLGGIRQRPEFTGLSVVQTRLQPSAPPAEGTTFVVRGASSLSVAVTVWCDARADGAVADAGAMMAATRVSAASPSVAPANLDVILDIDLPLAVRFGETEMTLRALTQLGPGSIIDLGRSPDDPVDVLVNGKLVARAEVVVIGGNYGVRIVEVMSPADRLRTVAA